ncbi:MAG: YCF48-related protein [Candidatus Manganitrophus sp.]|nr:YCF48-related protein [Candidatus Manganitrophus sp.]
MQSKTIEVGLSNPVAWKHQNPKPTSYPINDVTFSEEGVAWAVADSGTILRSPPESPDYGNNWIPVVSGTGEDLRAIRFVNSFEGWIVGDSGTILHSSDGGATWEAESEFDHPTASVGLFSRRVPWMGGGRRGNHSLSGWRRILGADRFRKNRPISHPCLHERCNARVDYHEQCERFDLMDGR